MIPLTVKDLHFSYEDKKILDGIHLELAEGRVATVIGLSGCGKSTLCYCICGIIPHIIDGATNGAVEIFGEKVSDIQLSDISKKVGIVFQNPDTQLFSPTVEDEIAFGPENLCIDREEIASRIEKSLRIVGLDDFRQRHPHNLSGGEKQLVAIASVLSMQPEILIFDESLSQIDSEGRARVKKVIKGLKEMGKSVITVEHDINNLDIADEVFLLHSGRLEPISAKGIKEEDVFYRT